MSNDEIAFAELLRSTFDNGGRLYFIGCGGSAADAEHLAAEFLGRCSRTRRPLPAIALTSSAVITCIANDFAWDEVFARQVQALVGPQDLVVGLTTSARSEAVLLALVVARNYGARTLLCSGDHPDGRAEAKRCTLSYLAPGDTPAAIQEAYMAWWHRVITQLEEMIA